MITALTALLVMVSLRLVSTNSAPGRRRGSVDGGVEVLYDDEEGTLEGAGETELY